MIEGEAPGHTWPLLAEGEGAVAPTEEVVAQGLEVAKAEIAQADRVPGGVHRRRTA